MDQETKTILSLLKDPDSADLGFDMAKQRISNRNVQLLLIDWVRSFDREHAQANLSNLSWLFKTKYLAPRIRTFLQILEITDDEGRGIEDSE